MTNSSRITIPKGFRFHPSDEELLSHYLEKKNHGMDSDIIPEIDVCKHDPCDLPALVFTRAEFLDKEWFTMADSSDMQWYFFSPRVYKYSNSPRTNRTTQQGSWKIQGKDRGIKAGGSKAEIGRKRTLTFYQRGEPKAKKTNWVIHEYYLTQANSDPPKQIGDFVLCRLRNKSDESDLDNKDSPLCNRGEPGSGSCSMVSHVENQAAAKGMISTEAGGNLAFEEMGKVLPILNGNDDEAEPGSGSYHIPSDFNNQAAPNGMITEADENQAFEKLRNVLLISGGNDDDEAERGSGSYHFIASDFENHAPSNGMVTEAEGNPASMELGDALPIPNGNEDAFNGLQSTGSCLTDNDKNELSNCVEGQADICNLSKFDKVDKLLLDYEPENMDSLFDQLQPHPPQDYRPSIPQSPLSTKLGNVSHTTNVHNDECRKRTYPFGDSDPSLTKKKYISTNDDDALVSSIASNSANEAPEGYSQSGALLSINGGPGDFSHDNNFIEWDDLLSSFEDIDSSLAKFSDKIIDGGNGVSSDRNTEVVHESVKDHSALAIGAVAPISVKLQRHYVAVYLPQKKLKSKSWKQTAVQSWKQFKGFFHFPGCIFFQSVKHIFRIQVIYSSSLKVPYG
ncbi:hypothetical protein M0R45_005441 [Rubus argutus]|uniref:NAC domain-containing protein n=1 Tax=Rubus argutus TaxID=59490 RepID=A0AAW1YMM6_RUBAR